MHFVVQFHKVMSSTTAVQQVRNNGKSRNIFRDFEKWKWIYAFSRPLHKYDWVKKLKARNYNNYFVFVTIDKWGYSQKVVKYFVAKSWMLSLRIFAKYFSFICINNRNIFSKNDNFFIAKKSSNTQIHIFYRWKTRNLELCHRRIWNVLPISVHSRRSNASPMHQLKQNCTWRCTLCIKHFYG